MFRDLFTSPRKRATSRRLQLDRFEDRVQPSATYTIEGTTLTITGDSRRDVIHITDNGSDDAGAIVVQYGINGNAGKGGNSGNNANSGTWTFDGTITDIVVNTGNHHDWVTYTLTDDLTVSRSLAVDLGNGHDRFNAYATTDTNDTDDATDTDGIEIADGVTWRINVSGGNGKDTVGVAYKGQMEGDINLTAGQSDDFKENGKDLITAEFTLDRGSDEDTDPNTDGNQPENSGSDGTLTVKMNGGNGPDILRLVVNDNSADDNEEDDLPDMTRPTINIDLSGGNGPDVVSAVVHDNDAFPADDGTVDDNPSFLTVRGLVAGGNGPDKLTFAIYSDSLLASGAIDGGNGPDRATHTANVSAVNVENETVV